MPLDYHSGSTRLPPLTPEQTAQYPGPWALDPRWRSIVECEPVRLRVDGSRWSTVLDWLPRCQMRVSALELHNVSAQVRRRERNVARVSPAAMARLPSWMLLPKRPLWPWTLLLQRPLHGAPVHSLAHDQPCCCCRHVQP